MNTDIGLLKLESKCVKSHSSREMPLCFLALLVLMCLFRADVAQAQTYLLERKSSRADFQVHSGLAMLEGHLGKFDAQLRLLSNSPLRFEVDATADLRSLKFNGSDQLTAFTNGAMIQSIADPEMRIKGELLRSSKGSGCHFEGTVQRGKRRERLSQACIWKRVSKEEVFVRVKVDGTISSLMGDLPIQLPFGNGEASANASFVFVSTQ